MPFPENLMGNQGQPRGYQKSEDGGRKENQQRMGKTESSIKDFHCLVKNWAEIYPCSQPWPNPWGFPLAITGIRLPNQWSENCILLLAVCVLRMGYLAASRRTCWDTSSSLFHVQEEALRVCVAFSRQQGVWAWNHITAEVCLWFMIESWNPWVDRSWGKAETSHILLGADH